MPTTNTDQRRRGPSRPIGERIADAADRQLLDWIKNGIDTFSGQLDANDNPIMVRKGLSAAHMACVIKRLSQIRGGVFPDGRQAKTLMDLARERGFVPGVTKFNAANTPGDGNDDAD